MKPLDFTSKKTASDTSTIIISRDEFADRAAKAVAQSDMLKAAPSEFIRSLVMLSGMMLVDIEEELFGKEEN